MPNINVDINVLEFRDICSYAVLGGMGAQAKFNMYLGKLDPMDWNYKYLNPVTLARAVRSKGASMGHPMRRKSASEPSGADASASASAGAPGVAAGKVGKGGAAKKGSSSWLPMALRQRRSAQGLLGGAAGEGAASGDEETGKSKVREHASCLGAFRHKCSRKLAGVISMCLEMFCLVLSGVGSVEAT
eukprot:1045176-Pelagomonas_calceolata.AAC.2